MILGMGKWGPLGVGTKFNPLAFQSLDQVKSYDFIKMTPNVPKKVSLPSKI